MNDITMKQTNKAIAIIAEYLQRASRNEQLQEAKVRLDKKIVLLSDDEQCDQGMLMASFEILCCKRPPTPATDAFLAEVRSEVIEWLDAEITAIDTMYRGDPSYEHDAYWMKKEVLDLVESARKAFAAQLRQGAAL